MKKEELILNDRRISEVIKNGSTFRNVVYDTAIVVKVGGLDEMVNHADGTIFHLSPNAFNSIPQSVALDLFEREDIIVLSNIEAKKYMDRAVAIANEVNNDIIEYNKTVVEHNRNRGKVDNWYPMFTKKLRRGEGYTKSPFQLLMEDRARKEANPSVIKEKIKNIRKKKKVV